MATVQKRSYPASCFVLELDDKKSVGFFRSVEGGGIKTDVLDSRVGHQHGLWRQLAKPKYEDIKLQVGMSMSDVFYEWIESFFSGDIIRKNGAIVAGDFHYKERARRTIEDCLISEVTIPKLDGADRNACYMTVALAAERIRFEPGSGEKIKTDLNLSQKLWTPNNFSFSLDPFAEACKRVTKIESFTIKQQILEYQVGHQRDAIKVPGLVEFPNMTFFLPEADAGPLIEHFTKHVINGELQAPARHNGQMLFNDHHGEELCRIELAGVDLIDVLPDKSESGSEDIKQVKVEITVESMRFKWSPKPAAGA